MKVTIFATGVKVDGKGAIGLVLKDETGRTIRRLGKAFDLAEAQYSELAGPRSEVALGYRAILHGLWRAKRLGARQVEVFCDITEVVNQLTGMVAVPPEQIGAYLQVKALLNAFRRSSVQPIPPGQNVEVASTANAAVSANPSGVDDLPLWASTSR